MKVSKEFRDSLDSAMVDYLESNCELNEEVSVDDFEFEYNDETYFVSFEGIAYGDYEEDSAYYDGSHVSTGYSTKVVSGVDYWYVTIYDKDDNELEF